MASNGLDVYEESQLKEIQDEFGEEDEHLEENVLDGKKRTADSKKEVKTSKEVDDT